MPWGDNNKGQGPWGGGQPPKKDQNDIDDLIKKSRDKVERFMGSGNGGKKGGGNNGGNSPDPIQFGAKSFMVIGLVGLLAWMSTGVYQVAPEEEGVVLRFGKHTGSTGPGLHYHLPFPIEKVIKVPVTTLNRVEVGVRTLGVDSKGNERQRKILEESLMLTGDENIVDVDFEVQWKISDSSAFLFNIKNPEMTVKSVAESAMREVIGQTPIADAFTEKRQIVASDAKDIMQKLLDSYNSGIEVSRLQLREVQPPQAAINAFRDVQNAKKEKETLINQADSYRNDIIPRARGEAEKIMQGAEAYKEEAIAIAKGDASRFTQVYDEFKKAKNVTKQRMYLETMEEVMGGMDKIILDNQGGVMPYLPINELKKR